MTKLLEALQGHALIFDQKADAKAIIEKRKNPETYEIFNERPLLCYDIDKDEETILGDKVKLGPYLEALSNGNKFDGAWNSTSRPIIIFIGNDHLTLKSLGSFSAHRVHYYTIESVGEKISNAAGYDDYPDYKLVVSQTMMEKIGKIAMEQVLPPATAEAYS